MTTMTQTTPAELPENAARSFWRRLPVPVRAVSAGIAVTLGTILPWPVFASLNLRYPGGPGLPWCFPATAAWLLLAAWYLSGRGRPRRTALARRRDSRLVGLSLPAWRWAALVGACGWLTTACVFFAVIRLAEGQPERAGGLQSLPTSTIVLSIVTSSLVAGFGEEVGFRGFLQAPLERRYGPFVAILATGTLFGVMHASHSGWSVLHLPVYLSMSAFLGAIAWRTGSILPCIALHASLDPVYLAWMWRSDLPLVGGALWTGGADRWFVAFVVGGCAAAAATVAAYQSGMHVEAARPVGGPNDGATA